MAAPLGIMGMASATAKHVNVTVGLRCAHTATRYRRYKMSKLSMQRMMREVEQYRRIARAYMLTFGSSLKSVTPSRTGVVEQRFRYFSDRLDALLAERPSAEADRADRDLAVMQIHSRLHALAVRIETEVDEG